MQVQVIPNQRVIKQKHFRWQQRLETQVYTARMLDLPMTQALTINWEQILKSDKNIKRAQRAFFRRLERISKRLKFELAYIWITACGKRIGIHAHIMLFWPHRHIKYLDREIKKLSNNPYTVYIQSINLADRKDYNWGQYLADHVIKHANYSQNRNLGCSRNLSNGVPIIFEKYYI